MKTVYGSARIVEICEIVKGTQLSATTIETQLKLLTIKWDSLLDEEKRLKAEKEEVRQMLVSAFNLACAEDFPYLDKPEESSYHFTNPINGLVYKKSVATVGASFDVDRFASEHSWAPKVLKTKVSLDEDAAAKWVKEHPEDLATLKEYAIPGKAQIRLYGGVRPTEDDL